MLVYISRHKIKNKIRSKFDVTCLVCKLQTRIPKTGYLEVQCEGMIHIFFISITFLSIIRLRFSTSKSSTVETYKNVLRYLKKTLASLNSTNDKIRRFEKS